MKVDLDEIERRARLIADEDVCKYVDYAEYIEHAGPHVTIALISRIRELEGALWASYGALLHGSLESRQIEALLEKGVVLP